MTNLIMPFVSFRDRKVNLYRIETAGIVTSSVNSVSFASQLGGSFPFVKYVVLPADVGIDTGDSFSGSARIWSDDPNTDIRLRLAVFTDSGSTLLELITTTVQGTSPIPLSLEDLALPAIQAGALLRPITLTVLKGAGIGNVFIDQGKINRGAVADAFTIPAQGATNFTDASFGHIRADTDIPLASGSEVILKSRVSKLPLDMNLPKLRLDEARAWRTFMGQLADFENTFFATPPEYTGPATGYDGPLPLVMGALQLGKTLVCDGVTASTAILGRGDYLEAGGQLNMLTADATSDGAGEVTFSLMRPLRASPDDNSVVQIFAPAGTFRLVESNASWSLDQFLNHGISISAIETF